MRGDPNPEYADPISLDVMSDLVDLSSGIIVDKSSALDSTKKLRFEKCPVSREKLD